MNEQKVIHPWALVIALPDCCRGILYSESDIDSTKVDNDISAFKVQMKCFFIAEIERAAKSGRIPYISSTSKVIKV